MAGRAARILPTVRRFFFIASLFAAGCSGSGTAPSPAASPAPVPTPAPTVSTYAGTVTATNGGQPLSGVVVTFAGQTIATDAAGGFRFQVTSPSSGAVQLSGAGIVARSTSLQLTPRTTIALDAFVPGSFDLGFFRQFARDGFERPAALQGLSVRTGPVSLYLRTVSETGQAIDSATLATVQAAMQDVASTWMGGRFGLGAVERGTGTREGSPGWVTVKWAPMANSCGMSPVGGDWIQLDAFDREGCGDFCTASGSMVTPRAARHELGHALGYWHTDSDSDVMRGGSPGRSQCDQRPSQRETLHAQWMYRRGSGNVDPDTDPTSVALSVHAGRVVVD